MNCVIKHRRIVEKIAIPCHINIFQTPEGSCRSVCSDLGSNHPRPRFWKVFQSRLPVKHRNWVESYTNAGTARFYYDLVYFLLFSCLGFPEDLRKTNPAKVTRKLEIRWRKNAKHSHTSVLKQETCDKAPWLMSATPSVESKRLQQPWKWIKWIKWISQLLNPQKNAWGCGTQLHRVWSRMNGLDS